MRAHFGVDVPHLLGCQGALLLFRTSNNKVVIPSVARDLLCREKQIPRYARDDGVFSFCGRSEAISLRQI